LPSASPRSDPEGEAEVDAALDLLLHSVPPEDFDPPTLRRCQRELLALKQDAVAGKRYLEADFYASLVKQCQRAADVSRFSDCCAEQLSYFLAKESDARARLAEANRLCQDVLGEFEAAVGDRSAKMRAAQQSELAEFDALPPADLPARYNRPSAELLALRKREQSLVLNEQFIAADGARQAAEALAERELIEQHLRMQDDIERRRRAVEERHAQQLAAFAMWLRARRDEMQRARERDLEGPVRRLSHYQAVVERIHTRGLPPNPNLGFTTNRVAQREGLRALRAVVQTPMKHEPTKVKPRSRLPIPCYRAPSAVKAVKI
jgi:hypothetical protein